MADNLFDLASHSDTDLVAAFRRSGRDAFYDAGGVGLVLHCVYCDRDGAARALGDAGHRIGLHESAALGDVARLTHLLDAAPWSVDLLSPDGWTALHLAGFFGRTEAARLLIDRGADAMLWSRSFERNLAIHAAAAGRSDDLALLDVLIPATADADAVQDSGHSPLLIAAASGKRAWVDRLAASGADIGRRTKDGKGVADLLPKS